MPKKYALYPGNIVTGGILTRFYVSANALARFYKVDPAECIDTSAPSACLQESDGLIKLYPDPTGKYVLPGGDNVV